MRQTGVFIAVLEFLRVWAIANSSEAVEQRLQALREQYTLGLRWG
jgi:hypothetical protein